MWKLQENVLDDKDKEALVDFIQHTDRFTQFNKVKLFEQKWSEWQGCKYSVFVNSGSSADLIMLDAVKEQYSLPDDSEVLVPAVTWATNITSVIQARLTPVFVDINLNDLSFDYQDIEKHITKDTKIILVTHLLGIPANLDILRYIAAKHNLILLEDCCESHGAVFNNIKVGNLGTASTFSFYWGHHITTIEGGMICTDDEDLHDLLLLKRSHGLVRELDVNKHEFYKKQFPDIDFNFLFYTHGYNVRNTELHATIGIAQLERIDDFIRIRNENYKEFISIISEIEDVLYIPASFGVSSFCLPLIFKSKFDKDYISDKLRKAEVEIRPIVGGNLLKQPCFQYYSRGYYPNADIVHDNGLYIGNNQFVNKDRIGLLKTILHDKG